MTAHKWAKEMAQYAQDAAETDEPWTRWQFRIDNDGTWRDCCFNTLMFNQYTNYRRKPEGLTVSYSEQLAATARAVQQSRMQTCWTTNNA